MYEAVPAARYNTSTTLDIDAEFYAIVESQLDTSIEALEFMYRVYANPEEQSMDWPESTPEGTISDEGYRDRCRWRLGNIGHALDVVREQIESETDAQEWLEFKMAIEAAKHIDNIYTMIDVVIALEHAGYEFVTRLGIDWGDYHAVANR